MTKSAQSAVANPSADRHRPRLVLASGSRFRKSLLNRLGIGFESFSPDVDETAGKDERGFDLSLRLALAKARAGQRHFDNALIIGSDQVAMLEGKRLGKPGGRENAFKQLAAASGKQLVFYTGLCLLDTRDNTVQKSVDICKVQFRMLSARQIDGYLDLEQPFDCAGSIKSEALGISLLEGVHTSDPTGLIGLPLIALVSMLRQAGVDIP